MASPNTGSTIQALSAVTQTADGVHDLKTAAAIQTLPSIAQVIVGVSLFETLSDTVTVNSAVNEFATEELVSIVSATSSSSSLFEDLTVSSVLATGTPTFDVIIEMDDTVNVSERFGTTQTTNLVSSLTASEAVVQTISLLETSVVNVSNLIDLGIFSTITTTASVSETIDPGVTYNQTITATVNTSEVLSTGQAEIVVANATATEVLDFTLIITELLVGTVDTIDTTANWALALETLSDTATAGETFNFDGAIANELLCSVANANGGIYAKDFDAIAWVLNTQSGGLTNYNNFGFTSIAFHMGKLYATSPDGFFELSGDTDDGRNIDAVSKSGFLDFQMEEKKRISDVFIGYTGGDLEFDVETYDGPEEVYTYEMEYRDADAPRNSRVKPGKGLNSRFWRFTMRNIGGADFQIYDIAVELAKSQRRL